MNELVVERLAQKVSAMLEEMSDINLLIRRLTPAQELMNKLHERVESVQAAVVEMEKAAQQNYGQTEELQELLKPLPEAIAAVQASAASLEGEVRLLHEKESVLPGMVGHLQNDMRFHTAALQKPVEHRVMHHHHVRWSGVAACILLAVCILLWISLARAWSRAEGDKAMSIKYRYLEELPNAGLERQLHWADSAYIADPGQFEKATLAEEERQRHEWEVARQLEEDKEKADRSQQKVKASEEEYRRVQRHF